MPARSFLPILGDPEVEGWDETYYSHCFHEVMDYNPYRVLRGRRYKFVRNIAADLTPPIPGDLFRSRSWTAVRKSGIERVGRREISHQLKREAEELFDLEEDPMETTNRIGDPALQEVAAQMRQKLLDFRRTTRDPWLEADFQEGRVPDPQAS